MKNKKNKKERKKHEKKKNLSFSSKPTKTPMGATLGFIQMKTQNKFSPTNALVGCWVTLPPRYLYVLRHVVACWK